MDKKIIIGKMGGPKPKLYKSDNLRHCKQTDYWQKCAIALIKGMSK